MIKGRWFIKQTPRVCMHCLYSMCDDGSDAPCYDYILPLKANPANNKCLTLSSHPYWESKDCNSKAIGCCICAYGPTPDEEFCQECQYHSFKHFLLWNKEV